MGLPCQAVAYSQGQGIFFKKKSEIKYSCFGPRIMLFAVNTTSKRYLCKTRRDETDTVCDNDTY